jgi:LmbE family N-acetylglucosaminyl deacetylase
MVSMFLNADPWRRRRWLVLAPHPDDETLGTGALIAQAWAAGTLAGIAYLTDGSGSHEADSITPLRLAARRKAEAGHALFRLTASRALNRFHLDWKDASPAAPGEPIFDRSASVLSALCRRCRVDAIAVTALGEPHCDHAAAARLAYAVQSRARRRLIVAEYVVWADAPARNKNQVLRTAKLPGGRRRHALCAHRSQLTGSHGTGFRLAKERLRMPAYDTLYVRRKP